VNRVEGGDQVVAGLLVEGCRVLYLEAGVGDAVLLGFGAGAGDGFLREVVAYEAAVGEGARAE
jgi:hypothetical protein